MSSDYSECTDGGWGSVCPAVVEKERRGSRGDVSIAPVARTAQLPHHVHRPLPAHNTPTSADLVLQAILHRLMCRRRRRIGKLGRHECVKRLLTMLTLLFLYIELGIYIDVTSALDYLWWPSILQAIEDRKRPPNVYRLLITDRFIR